MSDADPTRGYLVELPELYALLPLFVMGAAGTEERTATTSPAKPPADVTVFDLLDTREKADTSPYREDYELDARAGVRRQGVLPTLRSWARRVDAELWSADIEHDYLVDEATVLGDVTYLLVHLTWAEDQEWYNSFAHEVAALRRDMRRVIRESDPLPLVCPKCQWRVEPMDSRSWFRCTGCNRTWTTPEVVRLYEQQFPMHLSDCARATGRKLRTLQRWVKDGVLEPVGRDTGGALFRLVDVERAAFTVAESGIKPEVSRLSAS